MDPAWSVRDPGWPDSGGHQTGRPASGSDRRHLRDHRRDPLLDRSVAVSLTWQNGLLPRRPFLLACREPNGPSGSAGVADMKAKGSRYRWFVVGIFFLFMLLHQT